jgi:hypothetical protein
MIQEIKKCRRKRLATRVRTPSRAINFNVVEGGPENRAHKDLGYEFSSLYDVLEYVSNTASQVRVQVSGLGNALHLGLGFAKGFGALDGAGSRKCKEMLR